MPAGASGAYDNTEAVFDDAMLCSVHSNAAIKDEAEYGNGEDYNKKPVLMLLLSCRALSLSFARTAFATKRGMPASPHASLCRTPALVLQAPCALCGAGACLTLFPTPRSLSSLPFPSPSRRKVVIDGANIELKFCKTCQIWRTPRVRSCLPPWGFCRALVPLVTVLAWGGRGGGTRGHAGHGGWPATATWCVRESVVSRRRRLGPARWRGCTHAREWYGLYARGQSDPASDAPPPAA